MAGIKVTNPITDKKEEITFSNSIGKMLWIGITVIIVAAVQNFLKAAQKRVPSVDMTVDSFVQAAPTAYSGPTYYTV